MPVLPDTAILGCRVQNFMWILIRHARQLLFAASHSSMAKQLLIWLPEATLAATQERLEDPLQDD